MTDHKFSCTQCLISPCCSEVCQNAIDYWCFIIDEYRQNGKNSHIIKNMINNKIDNDILLSITESFKKHEDIVFGCSSKNKIEVFTFSRMGLLLKRSLLSTFTINENI